MLYLTSLILLLLISLSKVCHSRELGSLLEINDNYPIVQLIDGGKIRGKKINPTSETKTPFYAFRHIPYAQPPIGDLRFEPPVPAKPWKGIIDGTEDRVQCIQTVWYEIVKTKKFVHGQEDCLYLNVYTPQLPNLNASLPVMVYVHGGTFLHLNSSYQLHAPDYFLDHNVIFVSFNYRLGVFGFASSGDLNLPGNYGMKDQTLAIKWVKNNIISFGGDPNKITLIGESAGSISVSYHVQSDLSKGLFHGAIMQSGTSLCIWSLSRKAQFTTYLISMFGIAWNLIACKTDLLCYTDFNVKNVLKRMDHRSLHISAGILNTIFLVASSKNDGFVFGPVIEPEHEGAFYSNKSHEMLSNGFYNQVPTIIGFTSQEAAHPMIGKYMRLLFPKFDIYSSALLPADLNLNTDDEHNEVLQQVYEYYWNKTYVTFNVKRTLEFFSDDQFNRPIRKTVLLMAKHSPVYYYRFAYLGILGNVHNKPIEGVVHSEDLSYMFVYNFTATEKDRQTRSKLLKLWTNFAKHGNPTPSTEELLDKVTWNPAKSDVNNLVYLNIDSNLTMESNPDHYQMIFWDNIYKKYGNPPFDTY